MTKTFIIAREQFVNRHIKDTVFLNNAHKEQVKRYLRIKFEIKHG